MTDGPENIGQLADRQLQSLTVIEEVLGDLVRGNDVPAYRVKEAMEDVRRAQGDASEILEQYEDENGPIDTRKW
jgi:hypothetical protein